MTEHTHLALLCAAIVLGLLIPPVVAVTAAPGEHLYRGFDYAQNRPDIDGDVVVWEDDRNGNMDIYIGTIDRFRGSPGYTGERVTSNSASQEKPSISGSYVVWQDNRNGNWDIYLYDRTTGSEAQLTAGAGKQWLPAIRGNYAAWYDDNGGRVNIVLYDIAGRKVKDVIDCDARTTIPGSSTEFKPALSEKYVAWIEDVDARVRYYDIAAGTTVGPVSTSTEVQSWPSLSGSLIAWEDYRGGDPDIYMTDLDNPSGGERQITSAPNDQVSPALSGSIVAWEDKRGAPAEPRSIYMYDFAREEMYVFLSEDEYDEQLYPAVSGNTIVWQRGASPHSNLYMFVYKPGAPVEPVATTIEVAPLTATLEIGETRSFQATVLDQNGHAMTGVAVAWASSNATVGTVDADGAFTALAAGTATVTASAGSVSGTAAVTVSAEAPVLDSVAVTPAAAVIAVGETRAFTAACYDRFGNPMTGVPVIWTSDNATVGTVDASGTFAALGEGTATVTATAGAKSAKAVVTVIAPAAPVVTTVEVAPTSAALTIGGTQAFTATVLDQFDNPMTGVDVAWASDNATVGTVDGDGLFVALAAGTTTVAASAGGISGTAAVTVGAEAPVLDSIAVTPAAATLAVGDLRQFAATAFDGSGNEVSGVAVAWASSNATVGTVGADGVFVALAEGTATVTATAGSVAGTAAVTVAGEEPAFGKIVVSPSAATLEIDDARQFDAVVFDRRGRVVPDAVVAWECSDETVGTIDADGVFTALAAGTATVTASAEGVTGTADVTVAAREPVLTSISVAPSAITLVLGETETFAAACYDQDGRIIPDAEITWACNDESVGTVGADGVFAALATGTATITASAEGVTGTAEVTVADLSSGVAVSPSAITLDIGDHRQFTATVFDPEGNAIPDCTITWSCGDETVGTIDADGLFTAACEGTATITASVDETGEIGTATVTVRPASPALARVAVSPSDFTIAAGNSLTLTATAVDHDGRMVPGTEVTWTCSDACIGTIDERGVFTALEEGTATITASAGGVSGTACVTVGPSLPLPACIEIAPVTAAFRAGETGLFTATVFDQCDNEMDWVSVAWSCDDPHVGAIDRSGLFTALAEGTTCVTASAGSVEKTAAVTVAAAPAPAQVWTGDSGGGDSGPAFDAGTYENLGSGETFTFSGITTSSVGSVSITAAGTIPKLLLTVKEAPAPSGAGQPADNVYEYVEITLSWANPNDIGSAAIEFTIPAAWLEEHGMAPEDVVFMRCVDGGWQILETEVLGEENGNYRFRATTPGFSTFAIAAAPVNATTPVETAPTITEETNATANATVNATVEATTAATTAPATTPAAPLVYAPFLAPLAFLLWARKRH